MQKMQEFLKKLYPKDAKRLQEELINFSNTAEKIQPVTSNPIWYKFLNLYVIYPDGLARKNKSSLESIHDHLEYIKELGCNAVHILPFLESPMVDKGFDISDFFHPSKRFGTLTDVKRIATHANELGLRLFMDLVFNHVSDQHEWFQKAINGDEFYRKFFITTDKEPKFVKKYQKDNAVWAKYDDNGTEKDVMIVFPENAGDNPHWRKEKDEYWYYHTFYPQQLDLNWDNPEVFYECAKILIYWAKLGFNFRFDAIPYIGLSGYKEAGQDRTKTLLIISVLNYIAKEINPEVSFIVEVFSDLDEMIKYFGSANIRQTELSYNYHLCTHLWLALIKEQSDYIWENMTQLLKLPIHAEWINFLRNHDELSLAQLSETEKKFLNTEVLPNGGTFREGNGISGRTFSFLGENVKRHLMAYFLLCSLPGGIQIPYGDEIAAKNIPAKKIRQDLQFDTRNINRGVLTKKDMATKKAKTVYRTLSKMLHKRSILKEYMNINPDRIPLQSKSVFAAVYTSGSSQLLVIINISGKKEECSLFKSDYTVLMKVNNAVMKKDKVVLGPYAGIWIQR